MIPPNSTVDFAPENWLKAVRHIPCLQPAFILSGSQVQTDALWFTKARRGESTLRSGRSGISGLLHL